MTVSIIITAHKNAEQLENILDQAYSQTRKPDEVIVLASEIDIEHTRGSLVILSPNRNDWGHEKRAKGLEEVTSDYFTFWNADDEYEPTFLEELTKYDEDLIYCNYHSHLMKRVVKPTLSVGSMTSGNYLMKTDIANKTGYNHRHYEADGKFIEEAMEHIASHRHVDKLLYYHR